MRIDDLEYTMYVGDGADRWPDESSPIDRVITYSRLIYAVGACDILFRDPSGLVGESFKFTDGVKIRLDTSNGLKTETKTYRLSSLTKLGMHSYRLYAVEDLVKYFYDASTGSFEDTSSGVLQKIAQDCGLKFKGDSTSDRQVWLGAGRKNYVFAQSVALRGYGGENSLMWMCVSNGVLKYMDLNAIDYSSPKGRFSFVDASSSGGTPNYLIFRSDAISSSGIANANGGYGMKSVENNIQKEKEEEFKEISVKNRADQVQISEDIRGQVSTPITAAAQIRSDNTHENYNKALYQNLRGFGTLSETLMVVTPQQTSLEIMDPVEVDVGPENIGSKNGADNQNVTYNGNWLVDSRVVQIWGNNYLEAFVLRREGIKTSK